MDGKKFLGKKRILTGEKESIMEAIKILEEQMNIIKENNNKKKEIIDKNKNDYFEKIKLNQE